VLVVRHICWEGSAFGVGKAGVEYHASIRTLCVWTIRGGCKPGDVVKRVTFMPCLYNTGVSSFRMFGHMLCYMISTLITKNASLGFNFQEFDGVCHTVADCFDDSL